MTNRDLDNMTESDLLRIVRQSKARAITPEAASNSPHRHILAMLCRELNEEGVTILCEPSLSHTSECPPDIVVIDPASGIHVVEVKGVFLDQVVALDPGGTLRIKYSSGTRPVDPIKQSRNAMFDIKNATERAFAGELTIPFNYWVVFPSISRNDWNDRWGAETLASTEVLFKERLSQKQLSNALRSAGRKFLNRNSLKTCPQAQLRAVLQAFGDAPEPIRVPRKTKNEGCLGERFDLASASYDKRLSDEQQRLVEQHWEGPRLIRGVAGSGKTVILAQNCARRIIKSQQGDRLFNAAKPRILALCFNRTLVPFIRSRIYDAYQKRTGEPIPDGILDVYSINKLMWHLSECGLWKYLNTKTNSPAERASHYIRNLDTATDAMLAPYRYDAIYIDEGQDFEPIEFELLLRLCRNCEQDPEMFVFYDDAQNLYGKKRPNWTDIGLNIVGRSTVMTQCFRNTKEIVEPAFNMLVGTYALQTVQNRQYADMGGLSERGLIHETADGHVVVNFAKRTGNKVEAFNTDSIESELLWIQERLQKLIICEEVRPEDILILAPNKKRANIIEKHLKNTHLPLRGIRTPYHDEEKDKLITELGFLTISTVHSAKGYDAYVVFISGVEDFKDSESGRAAFYVACTRAREMLEITGVGEAPLARELMKASRYYVNKAHIEQ